MMKSETVSKIVKASGVSSGELVLVHFWGEDADKEIANSFVASVAALGATKLQSTLQSCQRKTGLSVSWGLE